MPLFFAQSEKKQQKIFCCQRIIIILSKNNDSAQLLGILTTLATLLVVKKQHYYAINLKNNKKTKIELFCIYLVLFLFVCIVLFLHTKCFILNRYFFLFAYHCKHNNPYIYSNYLNY